jgi:SAM-dependent methyltransferase
VCDTVNLTYLEAQLPQLSEVRDVLEVGSYNVNGNCRGLVEDRGLRYLGLDIRPGEDVDVVIDITAPLGELRSALASRTFDLVLCMNVLEHVYRPHEALANMCALTRPGGYIVVVTPAVWDLHDWPHDFFRLNPDFFRRFASEAGMEMLPGSLVFSCRDTGRFFPDVRELPMIVPHMRGGVLARAARRAIGLLIPEAREAWTRIYLSLVLQKVER